MSFAAAFVAASLAVQASTASVHAPSASGAGEVVTQTDEHGRRAVAIVAADSGPGSLASLVQPDWQALGPFGGDVEDVQVSPVDPNLVLAALASSSGSGALYRSTDGGTSWAVVASLSNKPCYDLAFAPGGTAYVATLDGVWKSTNAGGSFTALPLGIGVNDQVFEIDVDPNDPLRLWCGVADAIGSQPVNVMLSVDGGNQWLNRTPPLASPRSCNGIAIDPSNSLKVYACFDGGQVWVSANGGTSWANRSAGLPGFPMKDIVHDGSRVLLGGGQLFGSQNVGLYSTVDDGLTWIPMHDGSWPSLVIQDIGIDPTNPAVILLASAGKGVFRSGDGGASWAFQVGGTGSLSVNSVSFAPGSSVSVFTGSSSSAVWKSTDGAASFNASSNGIGALDVFSVASSPANPAEVAIAFQGLNNGGVYTTLDGGQSWTLEALPGTRFSCVRFDPNGQLFAISSGPTSIATEGLYRRTGTSWTPIGPHQGPLFESDLATMHFSSTTPGLIWAGGADFGVAGFEPTIWRTPNGGGMWTKVHEGATPNEIVQDLLIVDPASETTLVAAFVDLGSAPQTGGALRSTNGGLTWVPAGAGLPATAQCTSLASTPADPSAIYLSNNASAAQPAVFRTTDGGLSWSPTGYVGQALRVACDANDASLLYIAQSGAVKVRASSDGGASFAPFDTGLATAGFVRDMRSSASGSQLLLASGTGAYATDIESDFASFCAGDGTQATACPCANSGLPGRGCDNSIGSGGAVLTASGATSPDTVVLSSAGELPSALSIFLQGAVGLTAGVPFGDGVRCVASNLKRLYVTNASGGVATAPGPGDPSITARSAALGDPIAPGTQRFYQVYYRDSDLGFCPNPPGNSWNVSNGVEVSW
jgi:hypothetical protein